MGKSGTIKVDELEIVLITLLKEITPTKECLHLFIAFLYKTYHDRLARLNKIKIKVDGEITQLKELRKALVEKNLSGVYSEEIFKEQNALIEEKMIRAQVVKDDAIIDKYNIDNLTTFVKTLLANLGEAYKRSTISQAKVLLGSVFPNGLKWNYNGGLNHTISPIYQSIRHFNTNPVSFCAGDRI